MADAFIIDAIRTRGVSASDYPDVRRQEWIGQILQELSIRNPLRCEDVDDVLIARCDDSGCDERGLSEYEALLYAGWPTELTVISMGRGDASGLDAVSYASMGIMSDELNLTVAVGAESHKVSDRGKVWTVAGGHRIPWGIVADAIATVSGLDRDELDNYAVQSHRNAERAHANVWFRRGLVRIPAIGAHQGDELTAFSTTDGRFGALQPLYSAVGKTCEPPGGLTYYELAVSQVGLPSIDHLHHAHNVARAVMGAGAVIIASGLYTSRAHLTPRARVRSLAMAGGDPLDSYSPMVIASERALRKAQLNPADVEIWEIDEVFAGIAIDAVRRLDINPALVNVGGGAIAFGQAPSAAGLCALSRALDALEGCEARNALIASATPTMATAMLIELP